MTRYFKDCKTAEELKKAYKKAARELHPDMNHDRDTTEEFKKMQAEFEQAFERLKSIHVNKDGEQYEKATEETANEFMDMINKLLHFPGVEVELCGSWVWVSGNTRACKDELKKLGFKWSSSKVAWYFHLGPYRKRSKKNMTMDDIREMYGSKTFSGSSKQDRDQLPA